MNSLSLFNIKKMEDKTNYSKYGFFLLKDIVFKDFIPG